MAERRVWTRGVIGSNPIGIESPIRGKFNQDIVAYGQSKPFILVGNKISTYCSYLERHVLYAGVAKRSTALHL